MYWTLELASYLEDAPWPATKDELIDFSIRTGAPSEVVENLQELEDDGNPHESLGLREPMYSSFHKDHKFVEAPIGKGLCSWEKKRYSSRQDINAKVKTPPDISVADVEVCPVVQELLPAQANSMFQRVKSMSQTGMMSMASTKASTNIC